MPPRDHTAELVRQIRDLVGSANEQFFKSVVDDQVKMITYRLVGGWASREKLSSAITDCTRAMRSVKALGGVDTWSVNEELHSFVELCERTLDKTPKSTGNSREAAPRKAVAVRLALDLILNCGDRMPTVDLVSEVAANLYQLATGKAVRKMNKYASELFEQMEAGGYPSASVRKGLDPDGKRAACNHLRENVKRHRYRTDLWTVITAHQPNSPTATPAIRSETSSSGRGARRSRTRP